MGAGGLRLETENQGGTGMTHSLPGLLCLFLLPSQRLFVLHSKYVCSLLLPSLSHLSPEPTPGGLPALPKCTSLLGTRASHSSLLSSRASCSWCPEGNLLPSTLTPPPSFLQDWRHVLAHRERILSLHAADLGKHVGASGTEAKPGGQVPTSSSPGAPRAEPEPSQCLPSAAWLTSQEASAASRRCSAPKTSSATDGWQWRQDRPCLFFLYWDWSPVGPCNILDIILKLKLTHLQICVTSTVIGQTLMREKDDETGTTTDHRTLSVTPRKFGL